MSHEIRHNLGKFLFYIQMGDNSIALLEYKKLPNRVLDFQHTEVPSQHRGKGLAEELVRGAFCYCLNKKLKVYPSCSYVQKFVNDLATEEEKKIVVESRYKR